MVQNEKSKTERWVVE